MSVVWKYELVVEDEQEIEMPKDAELLCVAEQHGKIALWARVIPTGQPTVRRSILIRGTGHPIWTQPYIGSIITAGGSLVWHVFDGGEPARAVCPTCGDRGEIPATLGQPGDGSIPCPTCQPAAHEA